MAAIAVSSVSGINRLFLAYQQDKRISLRNRLVELNIDLARKIAHKYDLRGVPYLDLEAEAILGLIAAVERFNPTLGLRFSSFAVPTIEGKIKHYLRDKAWTIRIPQTLQDFHAKKSKLEQKIKDTTGRTARLDEVVEQLNCDIDTVQQSNTAIANRYPYSLDQSIVKRRVLRETLTDSSNVVDVYSFSNTTSNPNPLINLVFFEGKSLEKVVAATKISREEVITQLRSLLRNLNNSIAINDLNASTTTALVSAQAHC